MKAIIYETYGGPDVLKLKEIDKPSPKNGEVLIKNHATGLNKADWFMLTGKPFIARVESGLTRPKHQILGSDVAGIVEAVGPGVTRFKVGDAVIGDLSENGRGGLAEFVCAPEDVLGFKPAALSFEQAAAVPMAALTAYQGLVHTGQIAAGQRVLINGASGGVGTFAVQIAKAMGAHVTAVCSTPKIELMHTLGADEIVDYTQQDFTQSQQQYDLIFAVNGYQTLAEYQQILAPAGRYVCCGGEFKQIFQAMLFGGWMTRGTQQTMKTFVSKPNAQDLEAVIQLVEREAIAPVMDQQVDLAQSADALRKLGQGHAKGKMVVTIFSAD